MSRTHFIPKSQPTALAAAFDDIPNDDLEALVAPPAVALPVPVTLPSLGQQPLLASLTEVLSEETKDVRFMVLRSFLSSLNLSLIAQVRIHLEQQLKPRKAYSSQSSVDQRADADDANGINSSCYTDGSLEEASTRYAGNQVSMPALKIAEVFGMIRSYVHSLQFAHAPKHLGFTPRPLKESIAYLESQTVRTPYTGNEYVCQLAYAGGGGIIPMSDIVAKKNAERQEENDFFEDHKVEFVSMGDSLTERGIPDAQAVEEAFDSLPIKYQINLMTMAANGCTTAFNTAYKRTLRGSLSAAGDMVLSRSLYDRAVRYLTQLSERHSLEVSEALNRGVQFKVLKELGKMS